MILKMDIDAVIQVKQDTSKSSSNVIRMENRVQKLSGYMESCSEVRDEIKAVIPENDVIAEEAQRWIDYQRAIDNALDIAQE